MVRKYHEDTLAAGCVNAGIACEAVKSSDGGDGGEGVQSARALETLIPSIVWVQQNMYKSW